MEFCLSSFFWLKIRFFLVKILLFLYSANGIKGKSRKKYGGWGWTDGMYLLPVSFSVFLGNPSGWIFSFWRLPD